MEGGVGVWGGMFPSSLGVGSREGALPPPQKIFHFLRLEMRILMNFSGHF